VAYRYHAFGIQIESEIECPQLAPGHNAAAPPDLVIQIGAVPGELEHPRQQGTVYQIGENQFLLIIDKVARYLVSAGRQILVEPSPGAADRDVRLFLLGSAMGALLYQRGVWPLHGSAVASDQGAVLFLGASGSGKSTLAGAFHQRGYRSVSDDVCAITTSTAGIVQVWGASPRASLWADSVLSLGSDPAHLQLTHTAQEKYEFPLQDFHPGPAAILAVYTLALAEGADLRLEALKGFDKVQALTTNTYRLQFLSGMQLHKEFFNRALSLAQQARIVQVTRPRQPFLLNELVDLVERDLTQCIEHQPSI
jgi:hypothetical protein